MGCYTHLIAKIIEVRYKLDANTQSGKYLVLVCSKREHTKLLPFKLPISNVGFVINVHLKYNKHRITLHFAPHVQKLHQA